MYKQTEMSNGIEPFLMLVPFMFVDTRRRRSPKYQACTWGRGFLEFAVECDTVRYRDIVIWSGINLGSRTPSVFLWGHFCIHRYVDEVIESAAIKYIRIANNAGFQQKNVRPYVAAVTLKYLKNANTDVLLWSARRPDLSPIEHVWDIICRYVDMLSNFHWSYSNFVMHESLLNTFWYKCN